VGNAGYHFVENSSVVGTKRLALQDPIIVVRRVVMLIFQLLAESVLLSGFVGW
jgi:hypothetical protein